MRPIETLRAGNWLWDSLHEKYIVIEEVSNPMIVQCVKERFHLSHGYISSIPISKCPITELGFTNGENGFFRTSATSQIVKLSVIAGGYSIWIDMPNENCIWLVDQLQNCYQDLTGEKLVVNLIGSKVV